MTAEEVLKQETGVVINGTLKDDVLLAMAEYAKQKCKEQRVICSKELRTRHTIMVNIDKVKDAPEPEFD